MSGTSRAVVWAIREDRTLSEHAKIAYLMLWSRGANIWPSLQTLGADMGASRATAKRAVQELESAGLLKRILRKTAGGDYDSNRYELAPLPKGSGHTDPTQGHTDPTGGVRKTPKDRNPKKENEGRNSLASRRARPAVERDEMISQARRAVTDWYSAADEEDLSDERVIGLCEHLARGDFERVRDWYAYLSKIFEETPYLDTHLAMVEPD